jgi:hypothetical protein
MATNRIDNMKKKKKGMVRCKLLWLLPVLCISLQGCIHGGLDDCPPMVNYAVAFKYTNHTGTKDRFYDDVKKINLYVFDEHNLVYITTTELSPYKKNFNIPLNLPMGNYHIIAWGNVLDDQPFAVTPDGFVKGETTLAEARLILQRDANGLSERELEKLFYGEIEAEIPLYINRVDTIPLMNDTNHVRVVLHWDHSGVINPTEKIVDYDEVIVRLTGSNAVYNFRNEIQPNRVVYVPYFTDKTADILETDTRTDWLRIYYYPETINEVSNSTVYDFKILRFVLNNDIILSVLRKKKVMDPENLFAPAGSPDRDNPEFGVNIVGNSSGNEGFTKLFKDGMHLTTGIMQQNAFDKYENYRIDVYFRFDELANTYVSVVVVKIQDWHKVGDSIYGGAE